MGPTVAYPGSPPPRRHSRLLIIVVVVVVVILVVGVVAYLFLPGPAPAVQVGYIFVYAPDDVCGLNQSPPIAFYGFNSSTGANQTLDFPMPNYNATACMVRGVSTNTTGFMITYAQVPLTIGGSPHGPGSTNASLNITIISPSSSFSGNLSLVLR